MEDRQPTEAEVGPRVGDISRPSEKEVREFWEWCGLKYIGQDYWRLPDYKPNKKDTFFTGTHFELPPVDLNNLFRFAVPKIKKIVPKGWLTDTMQGILESDQDPALALFWSIQEVIHGSK